MFFEPPVLYIIYCIMPKGWRAGTHLFFPSAFQGGVDGCYSLGKIPERKKVRETTAHRRQHCLNVKKSSLKAGRKQTR